MRYAEEEEERKESGCSPSRSNGKERLKKKRRGRGKNLVRRGRKRSIFRIAVDDTDLVRFFFSRWKEGGGSKDVSLSLFVARGGKRRGSRTDRTTTLSSAFKRWEEVGPKREKEEALGGLSRQYHQLASGPGRVVHSIPTPCCISEHVGVRCG